MPCQFWYHPVGEVRQAAPGRAISIPSLRCSVRKGAGRRSGAKPSRAGSHRDQLGRQAKRTRRGVGQPGKPLQLARAADRLARKVAAWRLSLWSATTTRVFEKPFKKPCPKLFDNAVMFISCGMLWTICRAKPTMIACKSCVGSTTGGMPRKHDGICQLGSLMGQAHTKRERTID